MASRCTSLPTILVYLLYFLCLSLYDNVLFANAQSFVPVATRGSISGFIDGKAMYVLGGVNNQIQTTAQYFSLDLSTSWDIASPAYTKLLDGVKNGYNPGALLNDSSTMFIMSDVGTYSYYNVRNGTLTSYTSTNSFNTTYTGLSAVTNPKTGRVYVPNGYLGILSTTPSLLRFDPATKTMDSGEMPTALQELREYSVAWSEFLDAMLFFGGNVNVDPSSALYRYDYADGSWAGVLTTGTLPSSRTGACLVPVSRGSKMVLFGGEAKGNVTLGDIYVLDVATWKWTRGYDIAPTNARAGHSCSVSNDIFVAYGGYIRSPSIINNPNLLVLYNLTSNSWVNKFTHTPPPITSPPNTSSPSTPLPTGSGPGSGSGPGDSNSGSESSSGSHSNLGAIIGGVAAGVVVICGLAFWGYSRRKAKDRKLEDGASQQGSPYLSDPKPHTYTKTTLATTSAQQQRFKESQLEEELALSHQIEEQMARLQAMQGRRKEVGSPVPDKRYPREPQYQTPFPVTAPVKDESGYYVRPPPAITPGVDTRNPQYFQMASEGNYYVNEMTEIRGPQQQN